MSERYQRFVALSSGNINKEIVSQYCGIVVGNNGYVKFVNLMFENGK